MAAPGLAGPGRPRWSARARVAAAPARLHAHGRRSRAGADSSKPTKSPSRTPSPTPSTSETPAVLDPVDRESSAPPTSTRDRGTAGRRRRRGRHAHLRPAVRRHGPRRPRRRVGAADARASSRTAATAARAATRATGTRSQSATLRDVKANPGSMEVSYTITWDPEGERGPEDEDVTLGTGGERRRLPDRLRALTAHRTSNFRPPACTRASRLPPIAWAVVTCPATSGLSSKARHRPDSASIIAVSV